MQSHRQYPRRSSSSKLLRSLCYKPLQQFRPCSSLSGLLQPSGNRLPETHMISQGSVVLLVNRYPFGTIVLKDCPRAVQEYCPGQRSHNRCAVPCILQSWSTQGEYISAHAWILITLQNTFHGSAHAELIPRNHPGHVMTGVGTYTGIAALSSLLVITPLPLLFQPAAGPGQVPHRRSSWPAGVSVYWQI